MDTILKVAAWSGLAGAVGDLGTPLGSFLRLLGSDGSEHPRVLAALTEADYTKLVSTWVLKMPGASPADPLVDQSPSPIQLGQVGVLGKTCRTMCSTTNTVTSTTSAGSKRKIKLLAVINQDDDCDVDILDETTVANAYSKYVKRIGAFPRAEEELSQEQLTGLHALFKSGRAPYVDMAVWGPYHHRLQRKRRLKGVRLNQLGEIQTVELMGPSDFEAWRECYAVFKVGAIMFEEISPARLDAYEKHIRNYHERYGRDCWALIYQADVRSRLENCERLRRIGKDEHDKAKKAGGSHDFDTAAPWEWVWNALIDLRARGARLARPGQDGEDGEGRPRGPIEATAAD